MSSRYPIFMCKADRDEYLNKLIANCYQVKARTISTADRELFIVVDVSQERK